MAALRFNGQHVSLVRRFLADNWLEALLQLFTLYIGWFIWFAIVASKGQTPAKQLASVYIHSYDSGVVASAGRVWMREIVAKYALPWFIGIAGVLQSGSPLAFFAGEIYFLLGALTILFNEDRRALWDYIAGTIIRYHETGVSLSREPQLTLANSRTAQRLGQLDDLKNRGLVTEQEYLEKRQEILSGF